jgi:hypothetical protein
VKTNDLKLKLYPAVIAILGLSLVALLMSRVEIQVLTDAEIDDQISALDEVPAAPPAATERSPAPPAVEPTPWSSPSPIPSPATQDLPIPPAPEFLTHSEGGLRISNQSRYPVRVALLPQQPPQLAAPSPDASTGSPTSYHQPVHWDFAPEEGSTKGLILSLPDAKLRLTPGDVLVAFAQDGSRRYWGPYVVGKTPSPAWSAEQKEWLLILQP